MQAIDDYINGNLTDAKKRGRKIGRTKIMRSLIEDYSYSHDLAFLVCEWMFNDLDFNTLCDKIKALTPDPLADMQRQYVADKQLPDGESEPDAGKDPGDKVKHMAQFTEADWRLEVSMGDTRLGYEDWVAHQVESNGGDPTWWNPMPRFVIFMDGGLVQSVLADSPMQYVKLDFDTEGAVPEDIHTVPPWCDMTKAFVSFEDADIDVHNVQKYFVAAEKALA